MNESEQKQLRTLMRNGDNEEASVLLVKIAARNAKENPKTASKVQMLAAKFSPSKAQANPAAKFSPSKAQANLGTAKVTPPPPAKLQQVDSGKV